MIAQWISFQGTPLSNWSPDGCMNLDWRKTPTTFILLRISRFCRSSNIVSTYLEKVSCQKEMHPNNNSHNRKESIVVALLYWLQ